MLPRPLLGVLVGAAGLAAGLVCLYLLMRQVGVEQGGSCASGGPFEIKEGQECRSGVFVRGFGGAIGGMLGVLLLVWSSYRYRGPLVVTAASGAAWSGFFGALGGGFLFIGAEVAGTPNANADYQVVGIIFLVFAFAGLAVLLGPVLYSLRTERRDLGTPDQREWLAWFAAVAAGAAIGTVAAVLVAAA